MQQQLHLQTKNVRVEVSVNKPHLFGKSLLVAERSTSFTAILMKNLILFRTCCGRSIRDLAASCDSVVSVMVTNCAEGYCCSNSVQTSLTCNTKTLCNKITLNLVYYYDIHIRAKFFDCVKAKYGDCCYR